jgi:hypothetical protein
VLDEAKMQHRDEARMWLRDESLIPGWSVTSDTGLSPVAYIGLKEAGAVYVLLGGLPVCMYVCMLGTSPVCCMFLSCI